MAFNPASPNSLHLTNVTAYICQNEENSIGYHPIAEITDIIQMSLPSYWLNYRHYSDILSFHTNILSLFQDSVQDLTWHLVVLSLIFSSLW